MDISDIDKETLKKLSKEDIEYLKSYEPKIFPSPSLTVDILIFTVLERTLKLMLIKRGGSPYKDKWAIPGGFLDIDRKETIRQTAERELYEETNIKYGFLKEFGSFSDVYRDPRTRVISIGYFALIPYDTLVKNMNAGDDAKEVALFDIHMEHSLDNLKFINIEKNLIISDKDLAFDHNIIIKQGLQTLQNDLIYKNSDIAFKLVNKTFTFFDLQKIYEAILGKELIKPNFIKSIQNRFNIEFCGEYSHKYQRKAKMYRLVK